MPDMLSTYQCPACTGPLHFVGSSGRLECDYCGSSYDVFEIEALQKKKEEAAAAAFQQGGEAQAAAQAGENWDLSSLNEQWGSEASNIRAYNCPSCGAELLCDATTAATSCPYCGNPTIVPGQLGGMLRPDFVLPFRTDKAAAIQALKQHYTGKGKRFLPKTFADKNHIEKVQGVYVPFWLFDGRADADVRFDATRSFTRREGKYEVTTTEHYDVFRSGSLAFEKVPVDASTRMPDDHMDSIEPFDYSDLKPFSTAYLPGFLADKYDVSAEDSAARADERCENSTIHALAESVNGYDFVSAVDADVALHRGKVHYALLPVWVLNTKWKGKDFLFVMNGQTGKMVGDLPVDRALYWRMFLGVAVPIAAALAAFLLLL